MKQKFTLNHLIRFIYNETSFFESAAIREQLKEDVPFRKEYNKLASVKTSLPKLNLNPSSLTIDNILQYSKHIYLEPMI